MPRGIRKVRAIGVMVAAVFFSVGATALGAFGSNAAGAKAIVGAQTKPSKAAPRITGRVLLTVSSAKVGTTLHGRVLIYNRSSHAIKMVTACPGGLWQMTIGNRQIPDQGIWQLPACSPGVSLTARPGLTVIHFKVEPIYSECSMYPPKHPTIDNVWCGLGSGQKSGEFSGMPNLPAGTYEVGLALSNYRRYDITPATVTLTN